MEKLTGHEGWMIAVHGGWSLGRLWLGVLALVLLATPVALQAANWRPLPDSGQEKCYDISGKEIVCPPAGQSLHGQDGQYHGTASAYHDNGNQTVTDQNSGLVWMKSDDGTARGWQDAVAYCQGLDFAGQTDWRLPTKFELNSIVDYGRSFPAIDPLFQCKSSFYWSDLAYGDDPAYAWGAFFNDGGDHWLDKVNKYYARCVRGGR
jgi:hypothetical protein